MVVSTQGRIVVPEGLQSYGGRCIVVQTTWDKKAARILVDLADIKVSDNKDGFISTMGLGSGVAVAIYDPQVRVGGMLHFLLPDSQLDRKRALDNPYIYADTGIPLLFRRAYKLGAEKERILCRLAGGGSVIDPDHLLEFGARNTERAIEILNKNGVQVKGQCLGGVQSMVLRLHLRDGRTVAVKSNGEEVVL